MNQAEKKARDKYISNTLAVMNPKLDIFHLCRIAQQQDRLYKVIHKRRDQKTFTAASPVKE